MLNLSILLEQSAKNFPTKKAFTYLDKSLTYAQVNTAANQIANGLRSKGIKKGDKVALSCFNLPYFPIVYYGVLKSGAVVVPLSVLLKEDEIAYHLYDSDAKAYFCFECTHELPIAQMGYAAFKKVPKCEQFYLIRSDDSANLSTIETTETLGGLMADKSTIFESEYTSAEDTAIIVYTSGTTGKPKGAELTHSNLFTNAIMLADIMEYRSDDTNLTVLPLFHIFAMTVLMNAGVYRGMHIILLPKFDAEAVFELMQKFKITIFAGVPTMFWGLINYRDQLEKFDYVEIARNLRIAISGGAPLPRKVLDDFKDRFNVDILESYGMSEGSPVVIINQMNVSRKVGSIGTAAWGVDIKIVNTEGEEVPVGVRGELLYRGPNVMKGYYKKPEETIQTIKNGWLHSGDVAVKDEDGFYYIVDRTKDMIIRSGYNVYPREVEEVMMQHEAISLVAVIGVPHEQYGEEIKACVVLKEGTSITEMELMVWTKNKIAAYKYPRIIEIRSALPMSATGKILKKELRK